MPRLKNEQLIDPKIIHRIGRALGGTHWQADLARLIDYSKSFMTRALNASRSPDEEFLTRVRGAMVTKLEGVAKLLQEDGLPFADEDDTKRAKMMILEACAILRKQQPRPVTRMIDQETAAFEAEGKPKRARLKKAA